MNSKTESHPTEIYASIKLGIYAHARWHYVARQLDGATPQPLQKMTFEGLLRFAAKHQGMAREVFTCYDALQDFALGGCTSLASLTNIHRPTPSLSSEVLRGSGMRSRNRTQSL